MVNSEGKKTTVIITKKDKLKIKYLKLAARKMRKAAKTSKLTVRSKLVGQAAALFHSASKLETDQDLKNKMKHTAAALQSYAYNVKHLKDSDNTIRKFFSKKPWCQEGIFGVAASAYNTVFFGKIMPVLKLKVLGKDALGPNDEWDKNKDILFLFSYYSYMEARLRFTQRILDAGLNVNFPPKLTEVENYFSALKSKPNSTIISAYKEYADNFFYHKGERGESINYNSKNDSASIIYKQHMIEDGRRFIDCDGYARLGKALFPKAGYAFQHYTMRAMIPENYKWPDPITDVHTITVLTAVSTSTSDLSDKKVIEFIVKDTAVITNDDVKETEPGGFMNIVWSNPKGSPIDGRGKTILEAWNKLTKKVKTTYSSLK